LIRIRYPRCP